MKFIDLDAQYQRIKTLVDEAVLRVLAHGQYIMGPEITACETALAEFVGVQHAILNASGTTALQLALMAADIKPGDEVITPAFSFFATAEVVYLMGAQPVYVDIDPDTYLMDVEQLAAAITPKTKAIIPVSLYGQCANMSVINQLANTHGLFVIEDAAQSFGATQMGKSSCALSHIACTSFFPSKPLGAYGDAGACFTNNDQLAEKMRQLLNHGQAGRYNHVKIGMNGRCDSIQAAVLLEKLAIFPDELMRRERIAQAYTQALCEYVQCPVLMTGNTSAWAQYTIAVDDRETVMQALDVLDIPTTVHYPKGLHEQPISLALGVQASLPNTEAAAQRVLSLPFHPYLSESDVNRVIEAVKASVPQTIVA